MNTRPFTMNDNVTIAEHYYQAMLAHDFDTMASYLHDNVYLISPLAELDGKEAVVAAAKNLSQLLRDIQFRAKFAAHDQIMFAYDFIFSAPIGTLRSAVLMTFADNLIAKIELFYDGRPFVAQKNEIFEK